MPVVLGEREMNNSDFLARIVEELAKPDRVPLNENEIRTNYLYVKRDEDTCGYYFILGFKAAEKHHGIGVDK